MMRFKRNALGNQRSVKQVLDATYHVITEDMFAGRRQYSPAGHVGRNIAPAKAGAKKAHKKLLRFRSHTFSATAYLTPFTTRFNGAVGAIFKVPAACRAAFPACVARAFRVFCKITGTASTMCHTSPQLNIENVINEKTAISRKDG